MLPTITRKYSSNLLHQAPPKQRLAPPTGLDSYSKSDAPELKQAEETATAKPSQSHLSGVKKAILCATLAISGTAGLASTASAATLAAAQTQMQEMQRSQAQDMNVLVLPRGTPRLDVLREMGYHDVPQEYSQVGISLGNGLFQDTKGNLAVVPFLSYGWDLAADTQNAQRVDLGTRQQVQRFGNTTHFVESSSRRRVYTHRENKVELTSGKEKTVFERQQDGSIKVTGPGQRQEYTIRQEGLYTRIERPGEEIVSVLRAGDEIRVIHGENVTAAASLKDGVLTVKTQQGDAIVTRSANGLITEIDGRKGLRDARIVRDGDTFLGLKDKDRMSVDDQRLIEEARGRYNEVLAQLEAVEPGFAQKHPLVASVLEYASANPALLTKDSGDVGFLQAGTLLGSTGATLGTVSALGSQAAAINLANSARALGAAALSAKAAAQAQAAAGNFAQAASLAQDAQNFATRAHAAKDQAVRTGGKAMKQAKFARIMAGTAGALQIMDGVLDYKGGKSDKALVEGAVAVTKARMDQLTSHLEGADREEAMKDYENIMKVMNELDRQANKEVRVGKMKIALGGLMVVSALLGPEAPPLLGAIGIAGTAGVTVYEHWGPIKSFLTGSSDDVPTFLDILPKNDEVIIHLDGLKKKK